MFYVKVTPLRGEYKNDYQLPNWEIGNRTDSDLIEVYFDTYDFREKNYKVSTIVYENTYMKWLV